VVRLYPLDRKGKVLAGHPGEGASLVAVAPDGTGVVTDLREHHLISGHHHLKFWVERVLPDVPPDLTATKTVNLDLPETHGLRVRGRLEDVPHGRLGARRVGEIAKNRGSGGGDATGKVAKSLLKLDHGRHALAPNGKRLAVLAGDNTKVTVYDLDRGAKLSEYKFPPDRGADLPPVSEEPILVFLAGRRRLVAALGIARNVHAQRGHGRGAAAPGRCGAGPPLPRPAGVHRRRAPCSPHRGRRTSRTQ